MQRETHEKIQAWHLRLFLECALPLAIASWAKVDPELRRTYLTQLADQIAAHGDDILYRGPRTREAAASLVDALAILSLEGDAYKAHVQEFINRLTRESEDTPQ